MKYVIIIFCFILGFTACNNPNYSPKPRAYFRIDFPQKKYQEFIGNNYQFAYPKYAMMYPDSSINSQPGWYNLVFPQFNARLHISYYPVISISELETLTEDSRKLAFKHTIKATGIDEGIIKNKKDKVYGIFYTIDGNTASSLQFYLTDSVKHYLRGALYFNEKPKQDSIQPVINFIKDDLDQMIKTFKWK